jgi:hypothetical protein
MIEYQDCGKEQIEDVLLLAVQEVSETAFEKFETGEISQPELEAIYSKLRHWTEETEQLLKIIN